MLQTVEAIINAQGQVQWLEEIPVPGSHRVLITILNTTTSTQHTPKQYGDFNPPIMHVGQWPQDLSLRREDIYNHDGR